MPERARFWLMPSAGVWSAHLLLAVFALASLSCTPVALSRPVAKIGLIAPFEGPRRALGYDAIYSARLALREANREGGAAGWALELVALDDGASAIAALRQVRALAADHDVVMAVHVTAMPVRVELIDAFRAGHLPVDFVSLDPVAETPDREFASRYKVVSNGAQPGALAAPMYRAMRQVVIRIANQVRANGRPLRLP